MALDKETTNSVREIARPYAEQMKRNGIPKEQAAKLVGDYELVDQVYNADKREQKQLDKELRNRNERGE